MALTRILPRHLFAEAHTMQQKHGEDVEDALISHPGYSRYASVLVLTNREADVCRKIEAAMMYRDADEIALRAAMLALDWHFQPVWYKAVAERLAEVEVPTRPLGGIFFHRTPEKALVVSLDWCRISDAVRILEFVLECHIDRHALAVVLAAGAQ